MIIYMSNIICVTNQNLCDEDFLTRMEKIIKAHPAGIILREKQLSIETYTRLAQQVLALCKMHDVPCILHSHITVAKALNCKAIHLPMPILRTLTKEVRTSFTILGASCHSIEEAKEAEALQCTYIIVGHIFETNCKAGIPPRGLDFLKEICHNVSIPVWAIGGISPNNMSEIYGVGAKGGCVMGHIMQCENPHTYLQAFKESIENKKFHKLQTYQK